MQPSVSEHKCCEECGHSFALHQDGICLSDGCKCVICVDEEDDDFFDGIDDPQDFH